ncbi:glutathione S-transferase family protein [Pseudovibrio denitrificans]|uniref:glutathione S-transferase family protein n=1 Tax=Pseudovibrio denitrificans TaxID=258256 RepID=UPI0039BFD760
MIFHHKDVSPYSEKIRLMLGYTGISWSSVQAPLTPPRPSIDPLVGGYRRIPVAQKGADVFCDTILIAEEIARLSENPQLSPYGQSEDLSAFLQELETDVFFACVASIPVLGVIKALLQQVPLQAIPGYLQDKKKLMSDKHLIPTSREDAKATWQQFLDQLESRLASDFLHGYTPGIADFSAVHMVWFREKMDRRQVFKDRRLLRNWFHRMAAIGHGHRTDITTEDALQIAAHADPRKISEEMKRSALIGATVAVGPTDYATQATHGELVGEDENRWVLARDTQVAGRVHVHLPKRRFALTRLA